MYIYYFRAKRLSLVKFRINFKVIIHFYLSIFFKGIESSRLPFPFLMTNHEQTLKYPSYSDNSIASKWLRPYRGGILQTYSIKTVLFVQLLGFWLHLQYRITLTQSIHLQLRTPISISTVWLLQYCISIVSLVTKLEAIHDWLAFTSDSVITLKNAQY
jgi:hypothetical protein